MQRRLWALLWAALALTGAGVAGAQPVDTGPTIEVEDAEIEDRVVPLDEEGQTEVQVRIGCEAQELPGSTTWANLSTPNVPDWAEVVVSPSSMVWSTAPGDCPSQGPPYEGIATVIVSLDQNAPAYEASTIQLEATVDKAPPQGPNRTYGPANGTVSFTPGYFELHNVRLDEKIQEGRPGETLVYEPTIENFSNHETRFSVEVLEAPDEVELVLEPASVTLGTNETGGFEVRVSLADPNATLVNEIASVQLGIQASSTGPTPGAASESRISIQAQFKDALADPRDSPGLGAGLVAAALAGLAAVRARS